MTAASPLSTPPEPTTPYPPRFRWLKRLGLSFLLLIAALLIARAWAVHRAQAAYDAEIASLRARGEPVTLEDLRQPPIPDEQNAAVYLQRALTAIKSNAQEETAISNWSTNGDIAREDEPFLREWTKRNGEALSLVRKLDSVRSVSWTGESETQKDLERRSFQRFFKYLPLYKLLGISAAFAARDGDAENFAIHVRELLAVAKVLDQETFSHDAALVVRTYALSRINRDMLLLNSNSLTPAARETFLSIEASLADDQFRIRANERRVAEARVFAIADKLPRAAVDGPMRRRIGDRLLIFVFDAPLTSDALAELKDYDQAQLLVSAPFSRSAISNLGEVRADADLLSFGQRTPHYPAASIVYQEFKRRAYEHMAAATIAIRIYQLEHGGDYPGALSALVPRYIAHLPADPYDSTGQPVRYALSPARLYCIGEDGKDDGGVLRRDEVTPLDPVKQ